MASRVTRAMDRALIVLTLLAAAYLALRKYTRGWSLDVLPMGRQAAMLYVALGIGISAALFLAGRAGGRLRRWLLRALAYPVALLFIAVSVYRAAYHVRDSFPTRHWPPIVADSWSKRLDELPANERAMWGARLAAHRRPSASPSLTIPADWPFPSDVEIARLTPDARVVQLWARTADGGLACLTIPADSVLTVTAADRDACERRSSAPAGAPFVRPARVPESPPSREPVVHAYSWPQYRADPSKSGAGPAAVSAASGWRTAIDGEIRASASASGDIVFVGAHGTGSITALDLATGRALWRARLPNWIHQDPVSDGRIVVAGFGDNWLSFWGRAPSGVAAYEVASGNHLWTQFDESSVMTSPVISDSVLVYGTAAGVIRKRSLGSGALLAERALPGGVIMAPPASSGDTVVFTFDNDLVCALSISTLSVNWCRTIPHVQAVGHSAATISGNAVILSASASARTISLREFVALSRGAKRFLLRESLFPGYDGFPAGQFFTALDLRDGRVLWQSPNFGNPRVPPGHTSGTATISGGSGAIVLPISDTLVVFEAATGKIRWTGSAHSARGPPLIVDDHVVLAGHDGVVEVRALADGRVTCRWTSQRGYDRAGPALVGDLLIFGDEKGGVEAIPRKDALGCVRGERPTAR